MKLEGHNNLLIKNSEGIAKVLQGISMYNFDRLDREKEKLFAVHLNTKNKIITIDLITMGIVNACGFHPRETFRRAIMNNAVKIIVAHNHPSGEPEPSDADLEITNCLLYSGKLLSIEVVDHIIFTEKSYYSFKDEGKI